MVPGSGQNRGDESSVGLGELTTMDYLKKLKDYGPVLFGKGFAVGSGGSGNGKYPEEERNSTTHEKCLRNRLRECHRKVRKFSLILSLKGQMSDGEGQKFHGFSLGADFNCRTNCGQVLVGKGMPFSLGHIKAGTRLPVQG